MANEAIERLVDEQIRLGRISKDFRDTYIRDFETGLGDQLMRGSDYTKKTQELAAAKRQFNEAVEQEKQKIQQERQRLDQWRERAESELNKMPELTTRLAAAEQALRDYKIYDDVNLPPLSNGNPAPPQSRPFNPPQPTQPAGLTRDEAASYIRDLTLLNGKANQIGIRHMKLFGEPLEDDLVTHYLTTGEDMEQHWRIKHGVDQRQRDLQAKQEADREAAMRERIRSELMTELSMDPSRITGVPTSTFGRNTPLFETYAAKSAQHHAQNNADDTGTGDFIRPEMKPDIAASRDRQAKASRMFSENFDAYGNPTTDKGKQLSHRYGSA